MVVHFHGLEIQEGLSFFNLMVFLDIHFYNSPRDEGGDLFGIVHLIGFAQ